MVVLGGGGGGGREGGGGKTCRVKAGSQYDASPTFRFVPLHRQFVNIWRLVKRNETKRNAARADGGIDLDSIPASATV